MNDAPDNRNAFDEKSGAEQALHALIETMARLRDPVGGCAWDLKQSFASLAPYAVEEAYEVAEAAEAGDMTGLREELGDLLLQVVFHAQLAREQGIFSFAEVAAGINEKLIRRHPHIFGDAAERDARAQTVAWEAQKAEERAAKAKQTAAVSALDGVATTLPALTRAQKLSARAARVGFDWPKLDDLFDKLEEEVAELKAEIPTGQTDRIADEMGDLMFVMANLCRKLHLDSETVLRAANAKFTRRFQGVEARLAAAGRTPNEAGLEEMENLWLAVKAAETGR
ncbi:nucleoside triphosphate pyrophosphohydrolase [Acidisoma cellulosilytica]|uniref:Nucleoside triphosphate pyrophosphohydrolase n=1 Tax=Acidisoma cellulosilyticum TaxID=2802395 RepID=A0A963Z2N6_9PROT|nr:nucleoside triphosphate pyrophosphohydrolase [Acidisoma cellulosilyticum]MCB8880842.1 nucleoside triphosphate pyrophosphohydrolase [Acidisoma cellulosilyticum]